MVTTPLDRLHEKVQQASAELTSLKKDRDKLLAEVDLMREENRRARRVLREHQELLTERTKVQQKLEQLMEKFDRLKV